MTKAKSGKKKKVFKIIAIVVAVLVVIELVAIGILGGIGPLGFLRGVMQGRMEGNRPQYSFETITPLENSPLKDCKICVLGSSVTYGASSQQVAVGEFLANRFGCDLTKEAVSGTTLVDTNEKSYIQRMLKNIDTTEQFALFVCQLSTNDATRGLPLGEIVDSTELKDFATYNENHPERGGLCRMQVCKARLMLSLKMINVRSTRDRRHKGGQKRRSTEID
ncbi:MAG: hypothetical protein HDT14_07730 [Oscillibacter sp.]|nr:hypothetical protein [Oscillibacter sp.]